VNEQYRLTRAQFPQGRRVRTLPHTDSFMRGDRYGTIRGYARPAQDGPWCVWVWLDKSHKTVKFHPENIELMPLDKSTD